MPKYQAKYFSDAPKGAGWYVVEMVGLYDWRIVSERFALRRFADQWIASH